MALPLLALGLLAGSYGQRLFKDRREDEEASQMRGLLGQAGGPMGPPDEQGGMGYSGGSGLLANPADPLRQLQFAAGVAGLRGKGELGSRLLDNAFARTQQGDQFTRQQAQQQRQFDVTDTRQAAQWGQTFEANAQEALARQAQQDRQAQQWLQSFNAGRDDQRAQERYQQQTLGVSQGQLSLAQQREKRELAGDLAAQSLAQAGPKLPSGYGYVDSASGRVAAPMQGTEDYGKVKSGQEALQAAQANIGAYLDTFAGQEKMTPGGKMVRTGGSGTELYGVAGQQLAQRRGQIIADVAKLRDMGVLQQGEMERIEDQLPDPTTFGSALFTRNKSSAAGYEQLRKQFAAKEAAYYKAHPWLVPAPPAGFK